VATRVLWLTKGLGPGGTETLLAAVAGAHDHSEFAIECAYVVPSKDHLAEALELAGVRCHCLSTSPRDRRWPWRLRQLVVGGHFEIVHAHAPVPAVAGRLAVMSLRTSDRPALVSTEHNAWATYNPLTRWANQVTIGRDAAIYAVSEQTRRSMSASAAQRCTTLHHGVDTRAVAGQMRFRSEVRRELGIADDEVVIGTVANYRHQKDYPNLLNAANELRRRGIGARVIAVGQGPLDAEVTSLRDALDLGDYVILTGYRQDATRIMSAFDVFTLASRYEGLPVALMDALALGLPVVATDVGGVAEALSPHDAVLVRAQDSVALADGWERVAESPSLRQQLGERSSIRSVDFDVAGAVAEYAACYRRLTPSGAAPAAARPAPASSSPASRTRAPGAEIRPATPDDRPAILDLITRTLGWDDDPRFAELFAWKHDQNPFGPSPMWVAVDSDRVVGLRAFMRWNFTRDGQHLRAVRAVDTATDPAYQGTGLFTALTMNALDTLHDDGIDFVFNTPNDRSLPGYLKMGWRIVGRVPVALRVRSPRVAGAVARARVPADIWPIPVDHVERFDELADLADAHEEHAAEPRVISTERSAAFLRWRYGNPLLDYGRVERHDTAIIVRGRRRGPARELAVVDAIAPTQHAADEVAVDVLRNSRFDVALRCGSPSPTVGFVPLPGGGPLLTWRPVRMAAVPPIGNVRLQLGDVELF
jgi:glycosyltransferase involved in cell wall biosynthesis/GNAT superfamily N-acetyltransferase